MRSCLLRLAGLLLLVLFTWVSAARADVVVSIGVDAARQTMPYWADPSAVVQCLLPDVDAVDQYQRRLSMRDAMEWIEKKEGAVVASGRVTARQLVGTALPYVDNSVNRLIVNGDAYSGTREEILRVLVPGGVAVIDGEEVVKPWPEGLDEWSHYHHDPAGTMVGGDTVVGPPRGLQWLANPKWLRNHDFMSSMHAMVTSGGRVFYIIDEGLRNHIFLPSDWKLIARDAFNGTLLWKQSLVDWHPQNWPLKSGPGDLPRRIVATPDVVYATAGLIQPLTAFDARTGEIVRTYEGTDATVEVIYSDGTLFVLTEPDKLPVDFRAESTAYSEIKRANSLWAWTDESPDRKVVALDAVSGKVRWTHSSKAAPLTLTVNDHQVLFHNGQGLVALDRESGEVQWNSDPAPVKNVPTGGTLRVAYRDGVAVFANGIDMTAFDARTGKALWEEKLQKTSHHCPEDLFIIGSRIWSPNTGKPQETGTHYRVFDLHTGEVDQDFVAQNIKGFPMHPRCYPSRATERFIMTNGMGTEFYEVGSRKVDVNDMVRGSCIYGIMPANGLLYKPADSCACFYQSKLEWFCALAPTATDPTSPAVTERLEKGPAYGAVEASETNAAADWPMYRGDKARSGYNPSAVAADLKEAWSVKLGGKLTQPVVVGSRVYVAQVDEHRLHALDAPSGGQLWSFAAGGRIDSSPTVYRGLVLFGSTDGYVYCLRAADGALVWRYLAAPNRRQHVAFEQLESVWPVHGSVMVENGTLYCLAGRNMFFDGGLRLALLDPATGEERAVQRFDERNPQTGENLQTLIEQKYMPVANADLFSSNGKNLFMQTQKLTLDGERLNLAPIRPGNELPEMDDDLHLFCQTGFLDTNWFHRSYWLYASNCGEGWGDYAKYRHLTPAGRIMAVDANTAYSFRADPLGNMLHPRQTYCLYAEAKQFVPVDAQAERRKAKTDNPNLKWQADGLEMLIAAMAIADRALVVAGPPDLADESQMFGFLPGADDPINRDLERQEAAWNDQYGGILQTISAETGQPLGRVRLESSPVFDGLAVAGGGVYLALRDGTLRLYR